MRNTERKRSDFQGWYLSCTRGYFHNHALETGYQEFAIGFSDVIPPENSGVVYTVPSFSDISELYPHLPTGCNNILFLPFYSRGTHARYQRRQEAIIKGHKLRRDGSDALSRGHVTDVFNEFKRENDETPDTPKVVVVDLGFQSLDDFMRHKFGLIKHL